MVQDSPDRRAAWEAEGRRLAASLDGVAAALVTGYDVTAVSHLALGMAAAQSGRRRVALGDLTGAAQPLTSLVADQITDEDPHGLTDVFHYGVSINRVARQVDEEGRIFVVPVGSELPDAELLASPRWRRIADGFRDVGALLLLVAPVDTPQLPALAAQLDGTVAADFSGVTQRLPKLLATAQTPDEALPLAGTPRTRQPTIEPARSGPRVHPALLVLAGLVLVAALAWAGMRVGRGRDVEPLPRGGAPAAVPTAVPTAVADSLPPSPADSAGVAAPDSGVATDSAAMLSAPPVSNPGDTVRAAAFAVELLSAPTEEAARRVFVSRPRDLLGATLAPVAGADGSVRYRVAAGGYQRRSEAQSLLQRVRADGMITAAAGTVERLPYAVQLESAVSRDSLTPVLNRFVGRGIAAYAMRQPNGSSHIYVGAFAEPAEARALLANLQASGIPAALVVRIGRPW